MSDARRAPTLATADLERLLLQSEEPSGHERFVVRAADAARVLSRPSLRATFEARYRFAGTQRAPGGEILATFEPKQLLLALTLDYETWQPLPAGVTINWERDVFAPAQRFATLAEAASAPITFFVEMGEFLYLQALDPPTCERMAEQLRRLVEAGHAVELHLHPNWLPELGARREGAGWHWDDHFAHAHDYPGDLAELIARCKAALENAVSTEGARYVVRAFRAGAYRAQPFSRLSAALRRSGIECDSSVFRGGVSAERRYDYTHAFSAHQPYLCSPDDPQLAARAGDDALVELPIAALEFGRRWSLDGAGQSTLADDLLRFRRPRTGHEPLSHPVLWRARERVSAAIERLTRGRIPRLPFHPGYASAAEVRHGHDYFVAIGHTKGEHDFELIATQVARVSRATRAEWVTLGTMVEAAREDMSLAEAWRTLLASGTPPQLESATASPTIAEIAYAVERVLPWAGYEVRVLGHRSEELAEALRPAFPWKSFIGADGAKANGIFGDVTPARFTAVVLASDEPAPESSLRRWGVELGPDGRLVVAVAFDPDRLAYPEIASARATLLCEWRFRLETADYGAVTVHEIPDGSLAGVVVARPGRAPTPREQLLAAMDWLYSVCEPADDPTTAIDPQRVLQTRRALCLGYASTLGAILEREGFSVDYATLLAHDHERGRGPHRIDSHEVLQVREPGRQAIVLDPMANVLLPHSLLELLRDPLLAGPNSSPDDRYRTRRYGLYATSYFYERAFAACLRPSLAVTSFDSSGSWPARLKVFAEVGRRTIYRKRAGRWRRVRFALDPRAGSPEH